MTDESEVKELSVSERAKSEARAMFRSCDLLEMARAMKDMQAMKEEAETHLSIVNAQLDVIRYELIPNKMDDDGIKNVVFSGIGRITLTADMFVSTKAEYKTALYEWLEDRGLGDIIQPAINSSTLKAFIKGRIKAGNDVPEEYLNITPVTRASITKVAPKNHD